MYVVGVDGGTTKTVALVSDEQGHVLGAARGAGSNWAGEDVEIPMGVVIQTVRQALDTARLRGEDIHLGVFTLAGADWPEDHTRREAVLRRAGIARQVKVKNDSFGGLRAGLTRPYGMVLAVGTGMNAAVISPDGLEWAFGYYETSGGGVTLARAAFEAVLRAEDGRRQATQLTSMILGQLGFPTVEAMLRASVLHKIDRPSLLSICPLIFEAAFMGDEAAAGILVKLGREWAEYATTMTRRFNMQSIEFELVLAGSVFKGTGPLLVDTITQAVHQVAPRASIVRPRFEPAVGSLLLALDAISADNQVSETVYANLAASAPGEAFFNTANGADFKIAGAGIKQKEEKTI